MSEPATFARTVATVLLASSAAVKVSAVPSPVMLLILAILSESGSAPGAALAKAVERFDALSTTAMLLMLLAAIMPAILLACTPVTMIWAEDRLVILVSGPLLAR